MGKTTTPDRNLAELAAKVAGLLRKPPPENAVFWFAPAATVTLSSGWKPELVDLKGGTPQEEGSGEEYTLSSNGFAWTITFAVTPATRIRVQAKREAN